MRLNADLTKDILICQEIVEKCFPLPKSGTKMTKLVDLDVFEGERFLKSDNGSYFVGCVADASYYDWSKKLSAADVIRDYSLKYSGSPFNAGRRYVKIETYLTEEMEKKIARPYSKVGGMGRLDPPQTGTDILGCDEMDKLIPEYHIPFS